MPETKSRLADDLSRLFNDAAGIAGGVRREIDTLIRSQLDRLLSSMDVVTREEFEAVKEMAAKARAEADALQARIRPHFLFNSMNMIAGLLPAHPDVAERAVLDLSDLFRAALGAGNQTSTLAEEVELAQRYLAIEQLRLGERLNVEWQQDEPLPWRLPMPRLVLQPLLENAVLHGISRLPEGGTVHVRLHGDAAMLRIEVRNPSLPPQAFEPMAGSGHAQRNIAHRLGHAFGPRARMVSGWDDGYYRCELDLPLERVPQ